MNWSLSDTLTEKANTPLLPLHLLILSLLYTNSQERSSHHITDDSEQRGEKSKTKQIVCFGKVIRSLLQQMAQEWWSHFWFDKGSNKHLHWPWGQCRAAEFNTMSSCKASLRVARMRLHKHWAGSQITSGRGKPKGKLCPNRHHLHFPLLRGKRKTKQSPISLWILGDSKNRRNEKHFCPCNNTYCIQCDYYSRTFSKGSRCHLKSWYNAEFLTIQILNEKTWMRLDK